MRGERRRGWVRQGAGQPTAHLDRSLRVEGPSPPRPCARREARQCQLAPQRGAARHTAGAPWRAVCTLLRRATFTLRGAGGDGSGVHAAWSAGRLGPHFSATPTASLCLASGERRVAPGCADATWHRHHTRLLRAAVPPARCDRGCGQPSLRVRPGSPLRACVRAPRRRRRPRRHCRWRRSRAPICARCAAPLPRRSRQTREERTAHPPAGARRRYVQPPCL